MHHKKADNSTLVEQKRFFSESISCIFPRYPVRKVMRLHPIISTLCFCSGEFCWDGEARIWQQVKKKPTELLPGRRGWCRNIWHGPIDAWTLDILQSIHSSRRDNCHSHLRASRVVCFSCSSNAGGTLQPFLARAYQAAHVTFEVL